MPRWIIVIVPKKLGWSIIMLVCCLGLLFYFGSEPMAIYTLNLANSEIKYDIMLDPGHGGIDPGVIGKGDIYEKHYVLDIVLQMAEILEDQGLKVGLTRDHDRDVSHLVDKGTRHRRDLLGRFKLMNQAKLGISVHANATKDPTESGAIVFYMKDRYVDKVYAQIVLEELEKVQVLNERKVVPRNTLILLKANPPVILVEVGFMTNPTDLEKLGDPQFRTNLAHALSDGIIKFVQWRSAEKTENSI